MFVGLCVAFTWLAPVEVVTLALKDYIPMMFTSDPTILQAINVHFYVMAVSICGDVLSCCLSGAIIGCGWQHVGAVLNILCFWIVGIPLAISLALAVQLGALGYLMGEATAGVLRLCSYIVAIAAIKWKKQSELAQKMAVLHPGEMTKTSVTNSSKDTNASKEKSSSRMHSASTPKPDNTIASNNATDLEQDSSKKNESGLMQDSPSNPAGDPNETTHKGRKKKSKQLHHKVESQENKRKSAARWRTVILRILVATPFILLCAGALVTGKMLVYHSTPCNMTTAGNETEYLPLDSPQGKLFQTMSTSSPLCTTKPTGAVTSIIISHLPLPTPTPKQG